MFSWISCPFLELVFSVLVDVQFDLFVMDIIMTCYIIILFNSKLFFLYLIMICLSYVSFLLKCKLHYLSLAENLF